MDLPFYFRDVSLPVIIGLTTAVLLVLYVAFKVGKLILKAILLVAALGLVAAAVWWFGLAHIR